MRTGFGAEQVKVRCLGLHLWKDSVICEVGTEAQMGMLGWTRQAPAYDLLPPGQPERMLLPPSF